MMGGRRQCLRDGSRLALYEDVGDRKAIVQNKLQASGVLIM